MKCETCTDFYTVTVCCIRYKLCLSILLYISFLRHQIYFIKFNRSILYYSKIWVIYPHIVSKPVVNSKSIEIILQASVVWDLLKSWRARLQAWPISMRVAGEDAWLAAWRQRPQPPHSLWRPPFKSIHTIFMQEERLPQRKQAPFKEKTIDPPQQIPVNLPAPKKQERSNVSDGCLPV